MRTAFLAKGATVKRTKVVTVGRPLSPVNGMVATTISLDLGFRNPRVNDTHWSFGINGFTQNQVRRLTQDGVPVQEGRNGMSVSIGKRVWELIRASITVKFTKIIQNSDDFVQRNFNHDGQSHASCL